MRISKIIRCLPQVPACYRDSKKYEHVDLETAYAHCQVWSRRALDAMGYRLKVSGMENAEDKHGVLFVSNHQGTLDPVLILASCPVPLSFISKKENESLPLLGRWATDIQSIHFDRETREGNVHMLRETMRYLRAGKNLLLFAEGTRSKSDQMNPFKKNSLQAAVMSRATIVPVTLNFAYDLDGAKEAHHVLKIHYGTPITYQDYREKDEAQLRLYVQAKIEQYIEH
ncbi:MAG: lysophospholipid acyltransferase family protein [Catenisphaera adipataccumulans]|jgi:1-acyl-sn-glycerol-3-phosphate acyltransferase|uniref:lysophospholipid acyltransferase family protein n=1 Tax=Catenisphaera adipataccumulans TaxID=700500 RepID=UPI003D8DD5E5